MRSFSAGFTVAKNKKTNAPVNLLEISWSARTFFPAKTIRLADRPFTIDATVWLPLVEDWGGMDVFPEETGSRFRVNLLNAAIDLGDGPERFSDFLRRYPAEAATATLYQWFDDEGLSSSDMTLLLVGRIEDPIEYDDHFCSFHLVTGFKSYGQSIIGNVISTSAYPNAPEDSIGKPAPVVVGAVEKVPGISLRKTRRTRVTSVALPGAATLDVGSTDGFPSSGTLILNDDEVSYTGISAVQFTGCSGISEFHYAGDEVLEKVSDHSYLFSDPAWPIKSISNIRVDGGIVSASDYTVDVGAGEVSFPEQPRRVISLDTKFLQAQFDEADVGNNAVDPLNAIDLGNRTSYARIDQTNRLLALKQTDSMPPIGQIGKALLRVEHFVEEKLPNDSVTVSIQGLGSVGTLSSPALDDAALVSGSSDISHNHLDTFAFPINNPNHDHNASSDAEFTVTQPATVGPARGLAVFHPDNANSPDSVLITFPSAPAGALRAEYRLSIAIITAVIPSSFNAQMITSLSTTTWVVKWNSSKGDFDYAPNFTISGSSHPSNITLKCKSNNVEFWDFNLAKAERTLYYDQNLSLDMQNIETVKAGALVPLSANPVLVATTEKSTQTIVDHFDITSLVNGDWSWFQDKVAEINYVGSSDGRSVFIIHTAFEIEYSRRRLASTDDVSADVEGIADDGAGTITGSADALIERPDHVFKWSLLNALGLSSSLIDTASFDAAGTSLAAAIPGGYRFGGIIAGKTSLLNLWRVWMRESRTRFFWDAEGKARLLFMPLNTPTAVIGQEVKTITEQMILRDGFKISRTPARNLINHIDFKYSRNWETDSYDKLFSTSDSDSISFFGKKEQPDRFQFDWVRDANLAQDLAAWFLAEYAQPNTLVECDTFLDQAELELGDIILFSHPLENFDQALAVVLSGGYEPGSGKKKKMDKLKLLFRIFPPDYYIIPGGYGIQAYGTSGYGGRIPL